MECPECGTDNDPTSEECEGCGARLGSTGPVAAPVRQARRRTVPETTSTPEPRLEPEPGPETTGPETTGLETIRPEPTGPETTEPETTGPGTGPETAGSPREEVPAGVWARPRFDPDDADDDGWDHDGSPAQGGTDARTGTTPIGNRQFKAPWESGNRRKTPILAIGAVVLAAALVVAGVIWKTSGSSPKALPTPAPTTSFTTDPTPVPDPTTPSESPSPAVDPRVQVKALDQLLDLSTSSRASLNAGIAGVGDCRDVAGSVAQMQAAVDGRTKEVNQVKALDVSAVPGDSAGAKANLVQALNYSIKADSAFVQWGTTMEDNGCANTATATVQLASGHSISSTATAYKNKFLGFWNPLAGRYGLRNRAVTDI